MAGADPTGDFLAAEFRAEIRETMRMGMPVAAEQLTWRWRRDRTFVPQDPNRRPYEWAATPTADAPGNEDEPDGALVVPYALEVLSLRSADQPYTDVGAFNLARGTVTLLDLDYDQIKTADYVTIGDSTYDITFTAPAIGLFDVTVWQVNIVAEDES